MQILSVLQSFVVEVKVVVKKKKEECFALASSGNDTQGEVREGDQLVHTEGSWPRGRAARARHPGRHRFSRFSLKTKEAPPPIKREGPVVRETA